jgi:hypothetical protein
LPGKKKMEKILLIAQLNSLRIPWDEVCQKLRFLQQSGQAGE